MLGRLRGLADKVAAGVASIQEAEAGRAAERDAAAAEWGDGGTRRPGWSSALAGAAPGSIGAGGPATGPPLAADAVPDAEVAMLHTWTEHLRAVVASGAPGRAVVHAAQDTGERLARHAFARLDLTLTPDGGGAGLRLQARLPECGTDLLPWSAGGSLPVRFDPADPSRVAFVWQGTRRSAPHRRHVRATGWNGSQRIDLIGLLPGRALVDGIDSAHAVGDVSAEVPTDLYLRLRTPDGLGPRVHCGHPMHWKVQRLLRRGSDVPVAVDPVSGELEDVLVSALTDELRPRFGELSAAGEFFVEPLRDIGQQVRDIGGLAHDVKDMASREYWRGHEFPDDGGFAPGDPILEPAGGVTFEQWVQVSAALRREGVRREQRDACAERFGLAAGIWAPAAAEWERRALGHLMLAHRFEMALQRALA